MTVGGGSGNLSKHLRAHLRVAVLWYDTVFAETEVDTRTPVTIGESTRNLLMVPDIKGLGDRHELFGTSGGAFTLNLTDEMSGRLNLGGTEVEVGAARKERGRSIQIDGKDWGVLDLGHIAIFFQLVDAKSAIARRPFWARMESSVLSSLLAALVFHLAFLISAFIFWEDDPTLTALDLSDRFMQIVVEEPPPEPEEEEEEAPDEDVGKKAGGEEGKFGEEDKKDKSKVPKVDGEMVDKVKDVGIHKALGSDLLGRGPLKNIFGDKTGFDSKLNAAMSGMGDELVVGHGTGGMGLRGTGTGGGGEGFGRIHGMGRIDTGGGRGTRAGLGGRKKKKKKIRVRRGKGQVSGFCKEKDIMRVVAARQRGITYCYEKELARNPELQGKVTMAWRVKLDGKVMKVIVESSTLGNKSVEGCMKRQVARWRFPKPEGGMCQIRFPFVFNSGL